MSENTLAVTRRLALLGTAMSYELRSLTPVLAGSEHHVNRYQVVVDLLEAWEEILPQFRIEMEKLAIEGRHNICYSSLISNNPSTPSRPQKLSDA